MMDFRLHPPLVDAILCSIDWASASESLPFVSAFPFAKDAFVVVVVVVAVVSVVCIVFVFIAVVTVFSEACSATPANSPSDTCSEFCLETAKDTDGELGRLSGGEVVLSERLSCGDVGLLERLSSGEAFLSWGEIVPFESMSGGDVGL